MPVPLGRVFIGGSRERYLRQLSKEWQLQPKSETWKEGRKKYKHDFTSARDWCIQHGYVEAEQINIAKDEYPPVMRWRVRLLVDYDAIPKARYKPRDD